MDLEHVNTNLHFQQLVDDVRREIERRHEAKPDQRATLEHEADTIRKQTDGWQQSLANPELPNAVRRKIEQCFGVALTRLGEIERELRDDAAVRESAQELVSAEDVAKRIERLASTLATNNPSLSNLELSQHIDSIQCFPDGRVVMRTCKLGAIPGSISMFQEAEQAEDAPTTAAGAMDANTRRRTRLQVYDQARNKFELDAAIEFAADVNRFAGLDDRWFWIDEFMVPQRVSWAAAHAIEVHTYFEHFVCSKKQLAEDFGKSIPTIRAALRIAEQMIADAEKDSA